MELWRVLAASAILLGFTALGVAMAVNFRGVPEEHARRSVAQSAWMRRVPPWKWWPAPTDGEAVEFGTVVQRVIGVIFALGSLAAMIAIIINAVVG
jgi:hypothetical protein